MSTLIVFGEGPTEDRLMRQVCEHVFPQLVKTDFRSSGGKGELVDTIVDKLAAYLPQPELNQPVCSVILADRDVGDTAHSIQQRMTDGLHRLLAEQRYPADDIAFIPVAGLTNVLLFARRLPPGYEVRIVLHIAQTPPQLQEVGFSFTSAATDDYVLAAALTENVLKRFAAEAKLPASALNHKITKEIPELLRANGVSHLEVKDLIGIYMATARFLKIKRTEDPRRFSEIVVERAFKHARPEFDRIFRSLIEAVRTAAVQEDTR